MLISELFKSIDGEGKRAGELTTFIRTVGCNMRCSYCDTAYSWKVENDTKDMSIDDILKTVDSFNCYNITLTGGEPLICKDIDKLVDCLLNNFYNVNIETNGSIDPYKVLSEKSLISNNLFFTIDYKSISSGENNKMNLDAFKHMKNTDVLKCVVGSKEDMIDSVRFVNNLYHYSANTPILYFSPIFGQIEPKDIVQFMSDNDLDNWKIQLQLHKYIYPVDARGV